LPPPVHSREPYAIVEDEDSFFPEPTPQVKKIPPYRHRKGFVPRSLEDFGDGGAYPEVHVAQYPLDMGRGSKSVASNKVVPLTVDSQGKIQWDAVLGHQSGALVKSTFRDVIPKQFTNEILERPGEDLVNETTQKTKEALENLVSGKIKAAKPMGSIERHDPTPTYIRYTPGQQGDAFNSGAKQRVIRMVEMPIDPLEPPKFRHKRVPRGPPSPPVPIMHSPPRKITFDDQQAWKIPPCISNWKNNKGYTIPLDKRLSADGRGLQEVQINDSFAKLSDSLYVAERNAREEVMKRASIAKKIMVKEKEKREEELRNLAHKARQARANVADEKIDEERIERDKIRDERRRDRERELRKEFSSYGGAKSKMMRDEDRDISEKIALGQAAPQASSETLFDQRLFNQTEGMDSGFGDDAEYNIYTKKLFSGSSAHQLYRPKKPDESYGEGNENLEKIVKTSRFKPDKGFSGADPVPGDDQAPRSGPVEFERPGGGAGGAEEADPFGLNAFLSTAKTAKRTLDKIGAGGHLHAAAGAGGAGGSSKERGGEHISKKSRSRYDN